MLDTLTWHGPKPLYTQKLTDSALYMPECESSGVYMWLVLVNDTYWVNYVGQSSMISNRLDNHIREFMSGRAWLYDVESLKVGSRGQDEICYNPAKPKYKSLEFLSLGNEYTDWVRNFLSTIQILVAPVGSDSLKRVESAIIRTLRKSEDSANELLDNYRADPAPSEPITIQCKWPVSVNGLNDILLI